MSLDTWKQRASKAFANWQQRLAPMLSTAKAKTGEAISRLRPRLASDLIGIDISQDFLKLTKLSNSGHQLLFEHFAILPVPNGIILKDEIKDPAALTELLRQLLENAGVTTKDAALAISRSSVIIKNITIDSRLTTNEIESRAWIEANRLFPDLVGNIYLDFNVSSSATGDSSQLDMTLVACRKDVINPYLDVLREAGLTVCVVDVNCYALERALAHAIPAEQKAATVALLNLNLHLSTLLVIHDNTLVYAHDQSYDGLRLQNQVTAHLSTRDQAAGSPAADDEAYLAVLKENLSSHLRHTMHFFFSSRPNLAIDKIILSGDCASIQHLTKLIQQETNIETITADILTTVKTSPSLDAAAIAAHQAALVQCVGLSLAKPGGGY